MKPTATVGSRYATNSLVLIAALCLLPAIALAQSPADEPPETVREIFVPNSDLKVLLESEPHRMLLSRQEYEALVKKAKKTPATHVPQPTVIVSSDYDIKIDDGLARLHGSIAIDVLDEGVQAVPLDFDGVGLLAAKLDDQPAAIGYSAEGRLNLLVSGAGRHRLALELVAPLEMNSAQQYLRFRLTNAAVGRWRLTVPGDVEIKNGADVVSRVMDAAAKATRFELLPHCGDTTIFMSLNSHFQRREQAVAARCVLFDEVTEAYEKLHATVTCWILHRATDRFRFYVPEGFEITEINSPLITRWDIETEAGRKIVNVRLREQTTDTVVLSVAAIKTPVALKQWRMPRLDLLDVVGQVTVVGLLVQDELKAESLTAKDLIAVDTAVLAAALPASLVRPEPGTVPLRYIAAYYAPQGGYELTADFHRAARALSVTTNLLLSIQNKGCEVRGGFMLRPDAEKLFSFDFSVPPGWSVSEVTGPDRGPLAIERFGDGKTIGRIHVKLPQGIAPGQVYTANFHADFTPPAWLSDWKTQSVAFPMFRVADAQRDEGAVAVTADEDMAVRPDKVEGLVPITRTEMARFGMPADAMNVAYRYEGAAGKATIVVDRTQSRATARTFAFFQIATDVLRAHYVVVYTIDDAKTRRLTLLLPASTPEALKIRGLDGVTVKEFISEPADNVKDEAGGAMRRWKVLLDEARRGEVRLEVDFEMRPQAAIEPPPPDKANFPFPSPEDQKAAGPAADATGKITVLKGFLLPLVKADVVVYQSGLLAVEGDLELAVDVTTDARRADVGQLAISKYTPASLDPVQSRPGNRSPMRLLGTYEFVGKLPAVTIDVVRNPSYAITPAIVEKAKFTTLLSADGTSQTQAAFQLRTKATYLEFELPQKATLWSAVLDGTPVKPQKNGGVRLIGLPATATDAARSLQIVYEAPVEKVTNGGKVNLAAPRLLYRASRAATHSTEIPLANIEWNVTAPDGYEVVRTDGTLEAKSIARPLPAPLVVAEVLYGLGNGPVLISNLSGGGVKSASHQTGLANSNLPTQDNMVSEWGVIVDQDKSIGKQDDVMFSARSKSSEGKDSPADGVPQAKSPAPSAGFGSMNPSINANMAPRVPAVVPAPVAPPPASPASPPSSMPAYSDVVNLSGLNGAQQSPAAPALPKAPTLAEPAPATPQSAPTVFAGPALNEPASSAPAQQPTARLRGSRGDYAFNGGDLLGFRSLKIDVEQTGMDGQLVTFNSLGANPKIGITLARRDRTEGLAWAFGVAAFVLGMFWTRQPLWRKSGLVIGLGLISALLPLAWDSVSVLKICNAVFYAATLLVLYYLAAGLCLWILKRLRGLATGNGPAPVATAMVLVLAMLLTSAAWAQPSIQSVDLSKLASLALTAAEPPVTIPGDALIVPYDAKSKTGIQDADHLLVSYDRYVELWNRAYPDKKIEAHPAPLAYALAAAAYSAVLEGEESLKISGQMQVNVLAEGYASVPLGLRGGVLARADLDGKPAQLKVVSVNDQAAMSKAKAPAGMDATMLVLQVSGKGSHKLELEVRLKLAHIGGWRGTSGSLPAAPAATVTFHVPQAQTEVRLGQAIDRRSHETQAANETLETALGPGGALQVQWRPKVAEVHVDRGLSVQTAGVLDIQEDGLRLAMQMKLEFRRGQRDSFTLLVPADYLVEKVAGINVQGWEVPRAAGNQTAPNQAAPNKSSKQTVEIRLLKTAKESEQFNLFLSRSGKIGQAPLDSFAAPMVTVQDAALASGQLTIRRSGLLDLRTLDRVGVTRIDVGALPDLSGGPATDESVLAIRPYEAYHFPATPYTLKFSAARLVAEVTTEAQTRVTLDPTDPSLESKITFHIGQRRVYRMEIALPGDLRLPEVTLPAAGTWSIEKPAGRSVLEVYLQQGVLGDVALVLRGKLPPIDAGKPLALPRLEVLGVKRQEGTIALQADPAFTVEARELHDCQETERERVAAWLDPNLQSATRLALRYDSGSKGDTQYAATLRLVPRTPEVVCDTVTNVHVTDRAIEETIVLNYNIRNAGIRELNFLLPASMSDARISTPMLRRKTILPSGPKAADDRLHVKLELQGDAMNDLRVLIENDRLLTPGSHTAPLPSFEAEAGRPAEFVRHQYVVLERPDNRDELVVEPLVGLAALSRQQQQWQVLSGMLGVKQMYQAYLIEPGAKGPQLSFHLERHEDVETAGARIDLAETTIVVDANGAYRAKLELSLDNKSEQFLDVELPDGATLWAVSVAGEPVKPAAVPGTRDMRHVLLPVRKTAKGDVNYLVVLKYAGKMPPPSIAAATAFPLVRTVTSYPRQGVIAIERTQVEVYLPKSRHWFDFAGTVHSTEDEAELRAGRIAVFNKQGERLIEATHDADPFTRIRSQENLKNWVSQAEQLQAQDNRGRVSALSSKELQSQIAVNSVTCDQAKEVLKKATEAKPADDESNVDNRDRLNAMYRSQNVGNATGTLALAGNNSYTGATNISGGTLQIGNGATLTAQGTGAVQVNSGLQGNGEFNGNWLSINSFAGNAEAAQQPTQTTVGTLGGQAAANPNYMNNAAGYAPPGQQSSITQNGSGIITITGANSYTGNTIVNGGVLQAANPNFANGRIILNEGQTGQPSAGNGGQYISNGISIAGLAQSQPAANVFSYGPVDKNLGGQQSSGGRGGRGGKSGDQKQELSEYQQKLADTSNSTITKSGAGLLELSGVSQSAAADKKPPSQPAQKADTGKEDITVPDDSRSMAGRTAVPPASSGTAGMFELQMSYDPSGVAVAPVAPAGLASLDFELPTDTSLYELRRFTTPRGDAELTARSVSNSALKKLEFLVGLVVACVLLWFACRLISRGLLRWFAHPLGAALLLVAGLAAMCGGVLPVVGGLAFVTGIGLLIAAAVRATIA